MAQRSLKNLSDDEVYADWSRWIKEDIQNDLIPLGSNQNNFDLIKEIANSNQQLRETGGHILEWMSLNYVVALGMYLRREVDDWNNGPTLRKLLGEMEKRPSVPT